ncbi:MAG: ETC complex I subunit [Neomegalonema sp.]|nr:ETC complex I subunit [Neomegalonema sp.]
MRARIYNPAKTAMQSGPAREEWVLEFIPTAAKKIDPLMGWTGSSDTSGQVRIRFDSREAAETYARRHGIEASVQQRKERAPSLRSQGYASNFAFKRRTAWTH